MLYHQSLFIFPKKSDKFVKNLKQYLKHSQKCISLILIIALNKFLDNKKKSKELSDKIAKVFT